MRRWLPIALLLAALCGCAGMEGSFPAFLRAGPWWQAAQAGEIRDRARALEQKGELAMALDHWRLIERIVIDRGEARREIDRLEGLISDAVQAHYRNGVEKMGRKEMTAARNHFLTALRLDPAFAAAKQQIEANFSPFPLAAHRVAAGDTPAGIAERVYGNATNAFLVAWFNDLPNDGELPPDTLLILPTIDTRPPRKVAVKQPPDRLALVRARLAADDYDGALTLLGRMDAADPAVQQTIDAIHLKQAAASIGQGDLETARHLLATIPEGTAGRSDIVDGLTTALQRQQVDLDVEAARALLDRQAYQQSLDLAESVVQRAPQRRDARDLAAEARYRLALDHFDHGRLLVCRQVLEEADGGHAASMALKEKVRIRLAEQAQIHYRNGVKHFINEDLETAVREWEQALVCDPDHQKARENIDNARRLMQKVETLP